MNAVKREPDPTRVLNPNASEASYKPKQRREESVPPGVKNPRGRGTSGGEKLGGNTGVETSGGKGPSTNRNTLYASYNSDRVVQTRT